MVDFRYHLVSIIAIFLALALGVVVGTTVLNGQFVDGLEASIRDLTGDKRTLEATVGDQRAQLTSDDQLVRSFTPVMVSDMLTGERVAVLRAPGAAPGVADELVPVLEAAGATVTAQVQLRPELLDPARSLAVDELFAREAPGAATTGQTPLERAAPVLAAAVLRPGPDAPTQLTDGEATAVIDGLQDLELLDAEPAAGRASLAVLVAAPPAAVEPTGAAAAGAGAADEALLGLATALDAAGSGAVVAGPTMTGESQGLLRVVRDSGAADGVSTVDGADREPGRIVVAAALREQTTGRSGDYGSGPGSRAPRPSPSPS